jgi:hypothetical protein
MKRSILLGILLGLAINIGYAVSAHAQTTTDAAPWAGKCFGDGTSTCLVPELSFDVSRIRLNGPDAGKLEAGAVPLGAGYALLFGYDQWWASGPSVHAILDLSQIGANTFQVSGAATIFRYIHAGVTYARIGGAGEWFGVAGLTAPIDLVTGAAASRKAQAVRADRVVQAAKAAQ